MKLEQSFQVTAPVEEVWSTLIDIERVAPCLPGAEITDLEEDGTYRGDFKIKLGPTTAAYRGTLRMESLDEEAHVATLRGEGQDKRGQGSAKATVVSRMSESEGVTTVDVETDLTITGKLARFGRGGMIKDVSNRLMGEFAKCLQAGFEGEGSLGEAGTTAGPGASAEPATGGEATATAASPTSAEPPATAESATDAEPTTTASATDAESTATAGPARTAAPDAESTATAGPARTAAPDAEPPATAEPAPPAAPRKPFTPPAAAKPISGFGIAGSVVLGRAAPILLPVVRALRALLERLEQALVRESSR